MSREPRKARVDNVDADNTNYSEVVLDLVMSYLSLKNCVRTSILSSKWRYRWTTIPSLVFDPNDCCPRSCRYRNAEEQSKAVTNIINCVLLLHKGSIQVFQVRGLCAVPDIDYWILRVSKDSLKTLALDLWYSSQYQIPSSLFDCGSLSSLELKNCLLTSPPLSFKGFKDLKYLNLWYVTLTDGAFEKLISSSPLLEKLTLVPRDVQYQLPSLLFTCGSLTSIKLGNCLMKLPLSFKGFKNLKCLELVSVSLSNDAFEELISSCPLLENLALDECVDALRANELEEANKLKIPGFFFKLPYIQQLEVRECDEWFLPDMMLKELFQCKDLCYLAINMNISMLDDDWYNTLRICRSPRNLTEREIESLDGKYLAIEVGVWEDNSNRRHEFNQLKRVRMNNFCGTVPELEFLKFVLGNSPVLEEMAVSSYLHPNAYPRSDVLEWERVRSIYEFKRVSKAKIIVDGLVTQIC